MRIRSGWIGAVTVAAVMVATPGAEAQTSSADAGVQGAYSAALKCYVTNARASIMRQKQGDPAKAAIYNTQAQHAFDGAVTLGRSLGLTNRQINGDLDKVESDEFPRMLTDTGYFTQAVSACKAIGLM